MNSPGLALTAYTGNQLKRFPFITNLMMTLGCHQILIPEHKESLFTLSFHLYSACVCAHSTCGMCANTAHGEEHTHRDLASSCEWGLSSNQWIGVGISGIMFRSGCVSLSCGRLTLLNPHRLWGSVATLCRKMMAGAGIDVGRLF